MNAREILEEVAAVTRPRFDVSDLPSRERVARPRPDHYDRFMSKVDRSAGPDACWPYSGSPRFHVEGHGAGSAASFRVVAWELVHGEPPKGRLWMTCGNGRCANVAHLQIGRPALIGDTRFYMHTPTEGRKRMQAGRDVISLAPRPATASTTATLSTVLGALEGLTAGERGRVLAAMLAFYATPEEP